MYAKTKSLKSIALLALLAGHSAYAAEIGIEMEVGVGVSDNISRVPDLPTDPAIDDTILAAGINLTLEHESAKSDVDIRGSVIWRDYQDGPYDSETLPTLDGTAIFRITDQVLSWFAQGNVGQQTVDVFEPVTPGNREDVTYLTTGPRFSYPLNSRNLIVAEAWYSDINYEVQPSDNNRVGAQVGYVRQINPTRSLSLNLRGENTEFDDSILNPEIDRLDAFLEFDSEGSRNHITITLGATRFERVDMETEEPLATIEWERQVGPSTSLTLLGGTQMSDSADSFRGAQGGSQDPGTVQNQQGVTDPFREDFVGLRFDYVAARTNFSAGVRWSDEDYEDSVLAGLDRSLQSYTLMLSRRLGNNWEFGAFGQSESREYDAIARDDEDRSVGVSLTWRQLRTIQVELSVERYDRVSSDPLTEFEENRAFLGFRYIPDLGN